MENKLPDLQERLIEKIRSVADELINQEELKKLVEIGIHRAFFERRIKQGGYGCPEEQMPCLAEEIILPIFREQVRSQVSDWLKTNPDKTAQLIKQVLSQNIMIIVLNTLNEKLNGTLYNFAEEIRQKLNN
jgi:hypothetical protein